MTLDSTGTVYTVHVLLLVRGRFKIDCTTLDSVECTSGSGSYPGTAVQVLVAY